MLTLKNHTRFLSAVVTLAFLSFFSVAQGQNVGLVIGSGGNLEIQQGAGGTIPVFIDSIGNLPSFGFPLFTATLVVDADLLGQGEISFDNTGGVLSNANPSPNPFTQDLSIDLSGSAFINGFDGLELLGTLVFDTSNLNVGDTFTLNFAGSNAGNSVNNILSPTSNVQVTVVGPFLLGDTNMDGTVSFLDIAPFISLLSLGDFLDQADINRDNVVSFLDIAPFINILSGQ